MASLLETFLYDMPMLSSLEDRVSFLQGGLSVDEDTSCPLIEAV